MFGFLRKKGEKKPKEKEIAAAPENTGSAAPAEQGTDLPEETAETKESTRSSQPSDDAAEERSEAYEDKRYLNMKDADVPGLYIDPVYGGYWDPCADVCRDDTYDYWFLLKEDAVLHEAVKAVTEWLGEERRKVSIRILSEEQLPGAEDLDALLRDAEKAGIHIIRSISDASEIFLNYNDGYRYTVEEIHGWGMADDAADITEYWLSKIRTEEEKG